MAGVARTTDGAAKPGGTEADCTGAERAPSRRASGAPLLRKDFAADAKEASFDPCFVIGDPPPVKGQMIGE
jgi:hypothetical protein